MPVKPLRYCVGMGKHGSVVGLMLRKTLCTTCARDVAYADAGSDAEEAISVSEDEDVYDTSTDYDSDDEGTADGDTGQTQSSAAAAAAQQQVNFNIAASVLSCAHHQKGLSSAVCFE